MSGTSSKDLFFTVGGTLPLEATYVVRPTDAQLFHAILSGKYCSVLTPRQTGKSSLMVRTADRLRREGVRTAVIDLNEIGTELDAEAWYMGLATRLREQLGLAIDERAWWEAHAQKGAVQRFSDFLHDVVLDEIADPVVVFVDEIDSTLALTFTDDFFAAIRAAYNARASDPAYKRLTFVLLGVAWPADLIKDRCRTPYNIGLSIDLKDFSLEEARKLLPGLETENISPSQAEMVLQRVLYWTGGHPYLTQKVCAEIVASEDGTWTEGRIDSLVKRVFLSDEARKESNLQYVGDRVGESPDREKLLRTYRKVLAGKLVDDEERDPVKSQLKLAGLLKATPQGTLMVRNRIYEEAFDRHWVKATTPKLTSTRIATIASTVAVIALVLVGWLLYRGQNSDEILAQTYTETFLNTQSPAVRITNLAGLFDLGGEFADQGRDLFFGLDADQQLAMFTALNAPEQVGEDLQTVIQGLYAYPGVAPQGGDQDSSLLQAMANNLAQLKDAYPDSRILCGEVNAWLQGYADFQNSNYRSAIDSYTQAIEYNPRNPATSFGRALALAIMSRYEDALTDFDTVLNFDGVWRERVRETVTSDDQLYLALWRRREEYPRLLALVPTPTPTLVLTRPSTPTASPTPTRMPTSTQTRMPTPVPTPTLSPVPPPIPTVRPYSYPRPVLGGLDIIGCNVTLKWSWDGVLAENEWFDVRVGRGTHMPHGVTWTKKRTYTYRLSDAGDYTWQIAVLVGDPSQAWWMLLAISEQGSFSFRGCD